MDVLLPPLGNRPSPLQPQMPVKPERKTHIEPYEAEEDPNFSYDGFQVTRREYYAHMLEPAISFADGKLSINAVCLKKAPDVEYVQILVNREQKKLVIRPCAEDDWDSLKWCTAARKTKVITCRMFFAMIMDMMEVTLLRVWGMQVTVLAMAVTFLSAHNRLPALSSLASNCLHGMRPANRCLAHRPAL